MDLDEFSVGVIATLLIERRLRRSGADHRICALAKDRADATGRDQESVGGEGANFHRTQIHGADSAADTLRVEHGGKKFPRFEFRYFAFGFISANLLIERIKKLLAGSRSGKCGSVMQRATKATEIEQAFGSAVERHAHAIEQIDDARRSLAHGFDRRLVGEEVAAVNRVVKMYPGGVAFALEVLGSIDSALRANGMRTFDGHDREKVDVATHFGDLDRGRESGESATDNDDCGISWHLLFFTTETRSH